jgi:hypothetical protein
MPCTTLPRPTGWIAERRIKSIFTCGDCFQLAYAVHKITGWKLMSFVNEEGVYIDHSFIITPDGLALDIKGLHDLQDFMQEWRAQGMCEINLDIFFETWPEEREPGKNTLALALDAAEELAAYALST